jgi:hypothetical protein
MGDDTPIAALSHHARSIFNHLRQRFAQVTNPAMDHLRERSVMSLAVLLGPRTPLLSDDPRAAALEEIESFFRWERPSGRRLDATWRAGRGAAGLRAALRRLGSEAVAAAADGEPTLVVSDVDVRSRSRPDPLRPRRGSGERGARERGPPDALLDRGGRGRRARVASRGVSPRRWRRGGPAATRVRHRRRALAIVGRRRRRSSAALTRYREAIEDGIRKTLAKLGISCVDSYRGAEVVDVLGLDEEIVRTCFVSTPTALGGLGLDDVAAASWSGMRSRTARVSARSRTRGT